MKNKLTLIPLLLFIYAGSLQAQDPSTVEMADKMRSEGKIYVVVVVMSIVFIGLSVYLFMLDRKIGKLERTLKERKQ